MYKFKYSLITPLKIYYLAFNINIKFILKSQSLLKFQLINIVYKINKNKLSNVLTGKSSQICING